MRKLHYVGAFDPNNPAHDAWIKGVRAMARASNRAGRKMKLRYVSGKVGEKYRWKYQRHKRRLRMEDASEIKVYVRK